MRRPLLALALLLLAPLAAAQVYKWTDASGTVHYSETPPPQGTKYQQMTLSGSAEPIAQPSSSESRENRPEPEAPASVADTPANRARLCASLKSNLETLKGSGPVVMQEGGQQKVLDDSQRKAQIDAAGRQYQQYCAAQ
ncbi:DUF4124 domain-containing protein [Fulvimonas soli]|jgi:hypothetical protein|uniref:Uncharacterized protein DUF4124 n=1 Tax=Fulvimonas soli TaxID=155197 RepID=A0A316I2T1_9GAMM|nr:DUF4124 domain-containing protein [Fulvimonas soli]PWK84709.1 uncharacterized protein DUF4124 [Fulvimonas soli]TNY26351.1 DUF4124 domain-containing protein [Fulvimonas soli]